jgi:hypothetical protein
MRMLQLPPGEFESLRGSGSKTTIVSGTPVAEGDLLHICEHEPGTDNSLTGRALVAVVIAGTLEPPLCVLSLR